jgi:type III secretory pathway component EscT
MTTKEHELLQSIDDRLKAISYEIAIIVGIGIGLAFTLPFWK